MLFQTLDKIKTHSILMSILLMALGVVLLLCPEDYINSLISVFGYAMIVYAVVTILDFITGKMSLIHYISFTWALIVGIVGMSVLAFTDNVLHELGLLFGFLLVIDGGHSMFHAFTYARMSQRRGWSVLAVLSALLIIMGIAIFVSSIVFSHIFNSPVSLLRVIGFTTLFSALVSMLRLIWVWPLRYSKEESSDVE
ncbi:MAG: DUF308 domain-containing protein [Firmicutes bacterium]|nr:DUF308 domain-containing protein [Bacillota bacterium]MBQ9603784.1 DUF308 domain-containing protein [Bacillota bacterium]